MLEKEYKHVYIVICKISTKKSDIIQRYFESYLAEKFIPTYSTLHLSLIFFNKQMEKI